MRRQMLAAAAVLLSGCNNALAQTSTMGSTAMGLPSTPGAIVSSPLNGPSPFSAATQPDAPDTTLAPVPLASDPTTPGTVVTCPPPTPSTLSAAATLGTIASPIGSTTGTVSPASPPGSSSTTGCSSTLGGRQPTARICRSRLRKFRAALHLAQFRPRSRGLPTPASIRTSRSCRHRIRRHAVKT